MPISTTIPAITHVAVTVSDLEVSEAWYTKVLGVAPALDEDTGPFRHIVYPLGAGMALIGAMDIGDGRGLGDRIITRCLRHIAELESFKAL